MEYKWIVSVHRALLGFLLFKPGYFKTLDTSDELHCDVRELVTCGNDMGYYSWEFCRARTKHVKKIRSVHLDIRYPNRLCRSYGTPKNFGLTEPGDSMWVIKSCYGTFLLCLELDPSSTTDLASSTSLLLILDRDESSGYKRDILTTTNAMDNKKVIIESNNENLAENKSMINEAFRDISNLEYMVQEHESLDFTTKVLLIAAITTAGLCLICLVSTIGCFTIIRMPSVLSPGLGGTESRNRRSHYYPNRPEDNDIDPEETTVTSIPVLDPSEEENIYNVIPCDEQNACTNTDYKTSSSLDYEESKQIHVTSPEGDLHIYASTREISRDTGSAPYLTVTAENDYDRLRNTPRVSVSDSRTYDRLSDFIKERQISSQGEISKQNENQDVF